MTGEREGLSFEVVFGDWVEASWFGELDEASRNLENLLNLPAEVLLVQAVAVIARVVEAFAGGVTDEEMAATLTEHLVFFPPDPAREELIRDVVVMASLSSLPAGRAAALARHGAPAAAGAALECASFLVQAFAEGRGVLPSNILEAL